MGQIDEAGDVAKYLHGEIMAMKALIAAVVKVSVPKPLFEQAALKELQLLRDAFEPNPESHQSAAGGRDDAEVAPGLHSRQRSGARRGHERLMRPNYWI